MAIKKTQGVRKSMNIHPSLLELLLLFIDNLYRTNFKGAN